MNKKTFLPFALPDLGEEEIAEVVDTLRSGWITTGPKTQLFEQKFSAFLGEGVQSLAVNSATAGLHLALEALDIKPGDEVIVPSYTFTATAEVVRYLGAKPVIIDVDPVSYNINPSAVQAAVTSQTKAIIPVHFAGLACDMDAILKIAKKHHIKVVEDAAHALPSTYKGKLIGTLDSDVTVFSFYANKTMTTAEGGMLVSKNPEIIKRCKIMRLHGISRDAFDRYISTKPAWYYEVIASGFKYNMTDIAASIGLHQLKKLTAFHQRRQTLAATYQKELKELPIILPPQPNRSSIHAWHIYPIRLTGKAPLTRDEFIKRMHENGIGCSVHFIPLHKHPVWRDLYHLSPNEFPIAENIYCQEVTLPLYTKMTDNEQQKVIQTIRSLLT